jgi:hypothetical protein
MIKTWAEFIEAEKRQPYTVDYFNFYGDIYWPVRKDFNGRMPRKIAKRLGSKNWPYTKHFVTEVRIPFP